MKPIFSAKAHIKCNLGEYTLKSLFQDWNNDSYIIKTDDDPNAILIREKSSKVYGTDNVFIDYDNKKLTILAKPILRAYLLFVLAIMAFLLLLNAQVEEYEAYLIPVGMVFFFAFMFQWGVKSSRDKAIAELIKLLNKRQVSYQLMEEAN